ncbi:MAG: aminotransferase class V-fold PLP-dependent enzyme, partial [Paracoccaceae bacterium]|nr:aminotransferase class V-fold PLP-dependent enzyme [Paracoccaceae bacterium]
ARTAAVSKLMHAQEVALMGPLLDYLGQKNSVRLLGPDRAERRAPTFGIDLGRHGETVAAQLAPLGIMAGGGDFYGIRPLQGVGIDPAVGVLRISFTHYTTPEEIEKLLGALEQVI